MIAEGREEVPLEKRVLLKISGAPGSTSGLSTDLKALGINPLELTLDIAYSASQATLDSIIAKVGKINAIITDDPQFMGVASKDSLIPCIYITKDEEERARYQNIANVHVVRNVRDVNFLIRPLLREQTEKYERMIRIIAPDEKAFAELLLHSIYKRLIRIEKGEDNKAIQDRLYEECTAIGHGLSTFLLQCRGEELSVLEGESEYHEESGRKMDVGERRIFVKIMHGIKLVPGGKEWSAVDKSEQHYNDAIHFTNDEDFRVARAHLPLHYPNSPFGEFSIAMYDYIDGPTLNKVMSEIGDSIKNVEGKKNLEERAKSRIRNILMGIGQGLAHHQIRGLTHWITHAGEAKYSQSAEEVRTYYTYALQQLPEKICPQLPPGTFTDKENELWKAAVAEILGYLNYERKIARYVDLTTRNIIIERPELLKNSSMDELIRHFTDPYKEEGKKGVRITPKTQLVPYLKEPTEHKDPVSIHIDTNVRGMFFLEDFYHFAIDPVIWPIAGRYLEGNVRDTFVKSVAAKLGFDPEDIRDTHCSVVGFYRAARKVGNLVDFGENAYRDLKRDAIRKERYDRQIRHFKRDIHHYIEIGIDMLRRVAKGVLREEAIGNRTTIDSFVKCVAEAPLLTRETAEQYKTFLDGISDAPSRIVCQAAIAQAYLKKIEEKFSNLRYDGR